MASLLLLLAMMATTSSVFADDYTFIVRCDGVSNGRSRYCYVKGLGPLDLEYYTIEVIRDDSGLSRRGCKGEYSLQKHKDRGAISVSRECSGYFGIKPKVRGYPFKGKCGQNNFGGFKVINGDKADACRFPWMAFVKLDWKNGYRTSCGGSIVHDRWILTAAHCIVLQHKDGRLPPTSAIYVRTGSLDKWANFIHREIDWRVTHHDYNHKTLQSDVALLRLRYPIKWDGCHAPVCLNTDRNIDTNLTCMISGWGRTWPTGNNWPRLLRWGYDRLLTKKKCDEIYHKYSTDRTLCGRATSKGEHGFCSGDSGGPLVCQSKLDGRFYQHGVVSLYWSDRVCRMEGLYSSVAGFYNWIRNYVK